MKVYDVLIESEKTVDEGPVRFLKRTLGKNTAMGKAAQLDVEIDKEVKSIFKDYYAVTKQDPKKAGMTASNLSNFLVAKGFAGDVDSVMSYIQQDLGLGTKIAKAAVKGGKAVGKGAKKGAAAVTKAAKKVKDKLKPEPTDLTPEPKQGELDLKNSIYAEALQAYMEASDPIELDSKTVKKVIKRFVQQGFQKQLGKRIGKSSYGDADDSDKTTSNKKDDKLDSVGVDKTFAAAAKYINDKGFSVVDKEGNKIKA